ncbi:MAG: xanthine dehydrogenase family protein subunit M [Hyphomicrobiaceae bacterium]
MYAFDYIRPASVGEAANAGAADPDARYLAGGQTLIPTLKQHLANPTRLIDLGRIGDLKGIHQSGNAIGIGALTTHAEVAGHAGLAKACPALCHLAGEIADPSVRARGTIGGSLANNDPAADYPAAVLGLGATITTSKRNIAADDFFRGLFTTALEPGEIITGVGFQAPERAGYAKFAQPASRFALVGVFVAKTASGVRVAVTGAGEAGVFRATSLEQALAANFEPSALSGISIPPTRMLSDLHGTAEYRAALIPVMAERAVAMANASQG